MRFLFLALRFAVPFGVLVPLAACQAPVSDPTTGPATEAPADSAPATPTDTTEAESPASAGGSALPYVVPVACPFECCTYGRWTTTAALPVRARPEDDAATPFTLDAGTAFEADSGNVVVVRSGLVVADSAFTIYNGPTVQPGDTLYVLDTVGEGYVNAWYQGTVYETSGEPWNWGQAPGEYRPGPFPARLLRPAETRWWAHVRTDDGREGWIDMDRAEGGTLQGIDACG